MSKTRCALELALDLDDEDLEALGRLCDVHYSSIGAIVQWLACTAAAYTLVARGDVGGAVRLSRAARRAKDL